jgi:hypothetical protein
VQRQLRAERTRVVCGAVCRWMREIRLADVFEHVA